MEALYHQTNKMVHEVQNLLGRFERASGSDESEEIEAELKESIEKMASNCERLEMMVNKEPPSRRATSKLRVDQLKYDCQHLQSAIGTVQHRRFQKAEEERERNLLLHRNFAPNDIDTSIMIDAALQQNQRMHGATRNLDELLYTGNNILSNLREQGGMLKSVQKKVLDVMNILGLSNTVLRFIERRSHQDKFILFGGMILTCIVMLLVYIYLV